MKQLKRIIFLNWYLFEAEEWEKIKNPDLIYPNQVFSIPPLTQEEKDRTKQNLGHYFSELKKHGVTDTGLLNAGMFNILNTL